MKTIFPQTTNKTWVQQNKGDVYPVLFSSRNINMEKRGYIGLSRRMSYIKKDTGLTGISSAIIGTSASARYKFIGGNKIFNINYGFTTVTEDAEATTAGYIGSQSDLIVFNNKFWYTPHNTLSAVTPVIFWKFAGDTSSAPYNTYSAGLTTFFRKPMAVFANKNMLCVGSNNVVVTIDSLDVVNTTALTIPVDYYITGMTYLNNKMYISTIKLTDSKAFLFEWDGASASSAFGYEVGAKSILTSAVYDQSVVILTSRGELLRFGGGGFTQLAVLPFFQNKDYQWFYNTVDDFASALQALDNCMTVQDEYLYINIQNSLIRNNEITGLPEFVNGIYQYHKDFGLVHKFSPSQSTSSAITDYGQLFTDQNPVIGTLQEDAVSYPNSPTLATGVRFLAYSRTINPDLSYSSYLQSITSGESRGDFVTSKIYTGDITEVNQKLFVKYRNLINSTDKIVVKYRTQNKNNYPIVIQPTNTYAITWTSANTFTTTNTSFSNVVVGEEVTVTTGDGAGSLAHITSITSDTGTYTVTLDENITSVSNGDRAGIYVDNWNKLAVIENSNTDGYQEVPIGINGKWVQLKIEFRGESEPQIEEIILMSQGEMKAK